MRTSVPNGTIPYVWDQTNDVFDYTQLAANNDAIDAAIALPRTANAITQVAALPVGLNATTDRGKVYFLTSPDQSFVAGSIVRWTGSDFRNVQATEVLSTVPTLNNYDGRTVLLSGASGGFAAWTLIRYQGGTWYIVNQGIEAQAVLPSAAAYAGRVILLSSASGGFPAYSVVRSDGAAWALVGPQPIPPHTELAYYSQATDITTTNVASPGDLVTTFASNTYENVKYYLEIAIPRISFSVAGNVNFLLRETAGPTIVGNPISRAFAAGAIFTELSTKFPFTPTAGAHVYDVRWYLSTAGTGTINTTGLSPAIFRIIKAQR